MNMVPVTAALVSGILSSAYLPLFTALTAGLIFIIICIIRSSRGFGRTFDAAVAAFVFILGILLYHNGMRVNISHIDEYVTVRGIISELPYESGGINRYTLYCTELEADNELTEPEVKIIIDSEQKFNFGDSISAHGKLRELNDDIVGYGFDSRRSYASKGITAKMTPLDMSISDTKYNCNSISYFSNLVKSKIFALIQKHYSGDIAAAMTAVITGNRNDFSEKYNDILLRTATRMFFYPAFAHISLMLLLINLFSSVVPKKFRDFALLGVLVVYALFNSSNPSSVKCAAVLVLLILSKRITGSGSFTNMLALYITVSLVLNPMLVFNAGFVISSASTLVLKRFLSVFPTKAGIKLFAKRGLILLIGTMPLGAYFFGCVSIYSYVFNIIFIPIVMLILILSPLFLLNCAFGSAIPFGWLVHKLVLVLLHIPIIIDSLPFSRIYLPKPSPLFLMAFYSGAAALWYCRRKKLDHFKIYLTVAAGLCSVCLISALSNADKLELDFIDVGQGDASLIHVPFSGNILIDGGGAAVNSKYNVGKSIYVPYLTSHGINTVQAAFVSHYHKDHAEGIIEALKSIRIHNLFLPDSLSDSEIRLALENAANEGGIKIWYVSSPMHISMDDVDLYVYPPENAVIMSGDENDTSLMIEMRYGEFNCLFTGDMTANGEKHMIKRGLMPKADILKVSHHGSLTSTCPETVSTVAPRIALIGCGENNSYGFPRPEILERLSGRQIFRTDTDGTIRIFSDKDDSVYVKTDN